MVIIEDIRLDPKEELAYVLIRKLLEEALEDKEHKNIIPDCTASENGTDT